MSDSDELPKPLSEEDVTREMKKLGALSSAQINEVCNGYANAIKQILQMVKSQLNTKTDIDYITSIEQLLRIIKLAPAEELFIRSKDKIFAARHRILEKDADFFINRDYSQNIKRDEKARMIETLISIIQFKWRELSEAEKKIYWDKAHAILRIVLMYKKYTLEEKHK